MPILVTWIIPVTCLCIHYYRSKVQPQDILLHQAIATIFGQLRHVVYFCGFKNSNQKIFTLSTHEAEELLCIV